ncbi:toll/interleukin-1 receptor domain-containing protein [Streptomyces sp. TLI_55]|uniref:toll/interleukin-1 receptor domain-containing protein n=1 Tax=Streptomyces sp. TLI_55 TaxID=1938861 RepID=UPI0015CF7F42|nr:toll/interleukin-1 receptor domain-containing protein [Streptomyces sp. TLI_55]
MTGVEWGNLVIGIVGVVAAVAGVFYAHHEYRERRSAAGHGGGGGGRRPPEPPDPSARRRSYDVIVSYAAGDADAAELLAGRLRAVDLEVFLARWVAPGLVPLLEADQALMEAGWGVLLYGSGTTADERARHEYAALLHRKFEGGLRFVPARTSDDPLPPLAAIHQALDLTRPGTEHYDREVARLVRIVSAPRRPAGA